MAGADHPIHSTKTLATAFLIACLLAAIIFVAIVLPAEYNIDPTGIGEELGLTVLASPAAVSPESLSAANNSDGLSEDETSILVPAKTGLEFKFQVTQYEKFTYEWSSGESSLYFDLHGEPDNGAPGYFESFAEATGSEMKGTLVAPFTGSHGWYWRNNNEEDAIVTLKTKGNYEIIGLK